MRRALTAALLLASLAPPAAAQVTGLGAHALPTDARLFAVRPPAVQVGPSGRADSTPPAAPRRARTAERVIVGTVGWVGGAYLGAIAGANTIAPDCCGDDPGLLGAVWGAVIGSIAGAALGAAVVGPPSPCRAPRRLGRATLGSAMGAAVGIMAIGLTEFDERAVWAVPIGQIAGATLALAHCDTPARGG